jgi:hypothetical protein
MSGEKLREMVIDKIDRVPQAPLCEAGFEPLHIALRSVSFSPNLARAIIAWIASQCCSTAARPAAIAVRILAGSNSERIARSSRRLKSST